jgi:general secretion pathway protein F
VPHSYAPTGLFFTAFPDPGLAPGATIFRPYGADNMAVFTYIASDENAAQREGTIAADTPRQARDLLRERGLFIRDIREYEAPAKKSARAWRRFGQGHLVTQFVRELATLLGAGVPMIESLETIAKQHKGRFRSALMLLRDRVSAGASLGQAMGEQANYFDELAVNITEVGEDSGTLDSSLERLAEFRERSGQLKGKVATALIYPCIVLVVAIAASLFLMTFVVPKILAPLVEQGTALPWPTRVVKGISDWLVQWGWVMGVAVVGAMVVGGIFLSNHGGRLAWHRTILRLPLVGELFRKQAIVHMAVVMVTLLKSGIVFLRAIQIAQRTSRNLALREALARAERAVAAGGDIGPALEQTGWFGPVVVQIFAVGQQSGKLEEMLERLGTMYDQQVNSSAQRLAAILEPVLIILLAMLVLFLIMATVLPILEAGNAIQ